MKHSKVLASMLFASTLIFSGCGSDSDGGGDSKKDENYQKGKNEEHGNGAENGEGSENENYQKGKNEEHGDLKIDEDGNILNADKINELSSSDLSNTERETLVFIREEEKLARDVYIYLDNQYGSQTKVFANILKAEQNHTDAIKTLLEQYNIEDPVTQAEEDNQGNFENGTLQNLYNDLTSQGSTSITDAYTVGAIIEDYDIGDIEESLAKVDSENEDIVEVYKALVSGSENHMKAFTGKLGGKEKYTPTYISQPRYDAIFEESDEVSSPPQTSTTE